jgi:hypothetical protein
VGRAQGELEFIATPAECRRERSLKDPLCKKAINDRSSIRSKLGSGHAHIMIDSRTGGTRGLPSIVTIRLASPHWTATSGALPSQVRPSYDADALHLTSLRTGRRIWRPRAPSPRDEWLRVRDGGSRRFAPCPAVGRGASPLMESTRPLPLYGTTALVCPTTRWRRRRCRANQSWTKF